MVLYFTSHTFINGVIAGVLIFFNDKLVLVIYKMG